MENPLPSASTYELPNACAWLSHSSVLPLAEADVRVVLSKLLQVLRLRPLAQAQLDAVLRPLGFDFSLLLHDQETSRWVLAQGPRISTRIYWQWSRVKGLQVRDNLKIEQLLVGELVDEINRDWLVDFFAAGYCTGPIELNAGLQTVYKSWNQVPPAHLLILEEPQGLVGVHAFDNISVPDFFNWDNSEQAAEAAQTALTEYLGRIGRVHQVASEFSGGIDSGIVASELVRVCPGYLGGLTMRYGFPEFRREALFQEFIKQHAGFEVHVMDGHAARPFDALESVPYHDQPSVISTSWAFLSTLKRQALAIGAQVVLTGHGGDTLFEAPPSSDVSISRRETLPGFFDRRWRQSMLDSQESVLNWVNRKSSAYALSGRWHPVMLDSGFLNQSLSLDSTAVVTYTSGLIDPNVVNALAAYWSKRTPAVVARSLGRQKPVAYEIFGPLLPEKVWQREGKVNHLGLVYRGMLAAQTAWPRLRQGLPLLASVLELPLCAVEESLLQALAGHRSGDIWVTRMMALLTWLDARQRRMIKA